MPCCITDFTTALPNMQQLRQLRITSDEATWATLGSIAQHIKPLTDLRALQLVPHPKQRAQQHASRDDLCALWQCLDSLRSLECLDGPPMFAAHRRAPALFAPQLQRLVLLTALHIPMPSGMTSTTATLFAAHLACLPSVRKLKVSGSLLHLHDHMAVKACLASMDQLQELQLVGLECRRCERCFPSDLFNFDGREPAPWDDSAGHALVDSVLQGAQAEHFCLAPRSAHAWSQSALDSSCIAQRSALDQLLLGIAPHLGQLTSLVISQVQFLDALEHMAEPLMQLGALQVLVLADFWLDPVDMEGLCPALEGLEQLQHLDMGGCQFEDCSASLLAHALENCTHPAKLTLPQCKGAPDAAAREQEKVNQLLGAPLVRLCSCSVIHLAVLILARVGSNVMCDHTEQS